MSGLDRMRERLVIAGNGYGDQESINTHNKFLSFKSDIDDENSEQFERIEYQDVIWPCLINADRTYVDYDQKEISIYNEANLKPGCVFYWPRTDTHWIVHLEMIEEKAYFRAKIRQCNYELDIDGHPYWISLVGPDEHSIDWVKHHNIYSNKLNYSMEFYVTKDEITDRFFERFKIIQFEGHNWQVAAVDRYTHAELVKVYIEEYFDNEIEKEKIEIPEEIIPIGPAYIEGPLSAKPYDTNLEYKVINVTDGVFTIDSTKAEIVYDSALSCLINIKTSKSGKFTLTYTSPTAGVLTLPIVIKSL